MPSIDQSRTKIGLRIAVEPVSESSGPRKIERRFATGRGSPRPSSTDKVVLDAGCGMGRYLRIAAESSARLIVGLDLSRAVVAARELTAQTSAGRRRAWRFAPAPVRAGELRPDLLAGSARPHARSAQGVPRAGRLSRSPAAASPSGSTRASGLGRMDHERPARHFDPPAGRPCSSASAGRLPRSAASSEN